MNRIIINELKHFGYDVRKYMFANCTIFVVSNEYSFFQVTNGYNLEKLFHVLISDDFSKLNEVYDKYRFIGGYK